MFRETTEQNPDVHFIFKVHPSDNMEIYVNMMNGVKTKNYELMQKCDDIMKIIEYVDVQASVSSYSSFQAVVAGIPIILINKDFTNYYDQFENKIELRANDTMEFNYALKLTLNADFRKIYKKLRYHFLNEKLAYIDDSATSVMCAIFEAMACRTKK